MDRLPFPRGFSADYSVRFTYYVPGDDKERPSLRVGFLKPDQLIGPHFNGSFHWVGNCYGATIRVFQKDIYAYPSQQDIIIDESDSTKSIQIDQKELIENISFKLDENFTG